MTYYPSWFNQTSARDCFEQYAPRNGKLTCLQIGVFTGDATRWIANYMLTDPESKLWDVDTWEGDDTVQQSSMNWEEIKQIYRLKNKKFIDQGIVIPYVGTSDSFFTSKPDDLKFDFIYVDGDHTAFQAMKDGINSFVSLKVGGVLAFDDYSDSPAKTAIMWITETLGSKLEPIHIDKQAWYKKVKD